MNTKQISIAQSMISVPGYFQQVDSMPEDPEGSIPLMAQSDNAVCLVVLQPLSPEDAMPFDNPQIVIDGIHECMNEDQGLIEVEAGGEAGSRYIYSIVKTLKNPDIPEGVQYTLTLDKECEGGMVHAEGFFDEQGTTGLRDTVVFQMLASENGFDEIKADWMQDPYSPSFSRGLLMNKSEWVQFDDMFPGHPLTMAREFVGALNSVDPSIFIAEETALAKIESDFLFDLKRQEVSEEAIELSEKLPSDMDGLDLAWCLLTASVSTFITTSEGFSKWLDGVHDAASGNTSKADGLQKLLGKMLHHEDDWMDKMISRSEEDTTWRTFHRLLWGHDPLARGEGLGGLPFNPIRLMMEQEKQERSGHALLGAMQCMRHLVADTFSKQGLPLPGSSWLDNRNPDTKDWNSLINIVQKLSEATTGSKNIANVQEIYSHLFTLKAQDFIGGGAAFVLTTAYIKAQEIEDKVRETQIRLVAYSTSFFAQAIVGATRQNGVPYINYPVAVAMAKELAGLLIESNRRTSKLEKETRRLHESVETVIDEHEALKDLL